MHMKYYYSQTGNLTNGVHSNLWMCYDTPLDVFFVPLFVGTIKFSEYFK